MEYQKVTNLLGTTPDEMPRFITKSWIEVRDQPGSSEDRYKQVNKEDLKHQFSDQIYVISVMHTLLLKELLLSQIQIIMRMTKISF